MADIPNKPETRKETYLAAIAGQNVDLPPYPITREEAYLDEIAKNGGGGGGYVLPTATAERLGGVKIGSGISVEEDGTISASGSGGTSDYTDLTNKPSINGVTLSGNKTTSDLGINADNVMMSDGVTSVEEAVDELTEALTIGTVVTDGVASLDTWLVTDAPIESTGLYSVMYVSNAGIRYQLIVLGANLSTIQNPIGMTGNLNQVNNILLAKEDGTNNLCMYVSSGVGTGAYYVAKLMDLFGTV